MASVSRKCNQLCKVSFVLFFSQLLSEQDVAIKISFYAVLELYRTQSNAMIFLVNGIKSWHNL